MGVVTGRGVQLDISWHYCSSTEGMLVKGQTIQEWEESTHNINRVSYGGGGGGGEGDIPP